MTSPNTLPWTYNTLVQAMANLAVVQVQTVGGVVSAIDPSFQTLIPTAISYAENRIQRDMDLQQSQSARTYATTLGNNTLTLSSNDFDVIQTVQVNNLPLTAVSKEFLQNVYGVGSTQAQPLYFAMYGGDLATGGNTSTNVILGPIPDANYAVTVVGMVQMPSLTSYNMSPQASTSTTWIGTYLPDILLMATMIPVSAYQRDFSSTGNDPQMPIHYEQQYQALLQSAQTQDYRAKFQESAWTSYATPPAATAAR